MLAGPPLDLVTLGAQLRDRGAGLKVLEEGIDAATAKGRAMFGMLSVLAELQRELWSGPADGWPWPGRPYPDGPGRPPAA